MPDQVPGFRVGRKLRLELSQRLLIGDAQHFFGESFQLDEADSHREISYTSYKSCQFPVSQPNTALLFTLVARLRTWQTTNLSFVVRGGTAWSKRGGA